MTAHTSLIFAARVLGALVPGLIVFATSVLQSGYSPRTVLLAFADEWKEWTTKQRIVRAGLPSAITVVGSLLIILLWDGIRLLLGARVQPPSPLEITLFLGIGIATMLSAPAAAASRQLRREEQAARRG